MTEKQLQKELNKMDLSSEQITHFLNWKRNQKVVRKDGDYKEDRDNKMVEDLIFSQPF